MYSKEKLLDGQHWSFENYKQRIKSGEWKQLLLNDDDKLIFQGRVRQLGAKKLGYGVVEIFKKPMRGL